MEHLHDSIGSNRFVVRLFILVFACNIAFEANAPHMAETFHKEAVRADAIVDFQNLIGQQLHREQFCERMLFDLLCKFHCSVRGVSLIPHCIAAGIGEKRDPFGRKHTFTYLDFRGPEVIDGEYQKTRRDMQEIVTIKANIDTLMGYTEPGRKQEKER